MDRISEPFLTVLFRIKSKIEGLRQWMLSKHFEEVARIDELF